MAKKRTKFEVEIEDINLMPIMNLITLLIPFLLLSAQFIQIGIILVDMQGRARVKSEKKDEEKKRVLGLTINITAKGYDITTKEKGSACPSKMANGQPCIPVSMSGGQKIYNKVALRKFLYEKFWKPNKNSNSFDPDKQDRNVYSDWGKITIRPESNIPYDVVIQTLDASRELPPEAKSDVSGNLACVFKKPHGQKEWQLTGNCMFPFAQLAAH